MEKEDVAFLKQLIESLEDSERKLEEAYKKRDAAEFNNIKKFMLELQSQIAGALK
jgi:hypothetical protein